METLIGFAVGYYVGSRQGREGLERALASCRAIAQSPEFRGLLTTGTQVAGGLIRQSSSRNALAAAVVEEVTKRAQRALNSAPSLRAV